MFVPKKARSHNGELAVIVKGESLVLPQIVVNTGDKGKKRFLEFFTVNIRNPNTRRAYFRQAMHFLCWCEDRGVTDYHRIEPMMVAAYIEQ